MLVFWKERLVFLSVPKTGTTAWEAALAPRAAMSIQDPPELKHAPVYRYNRFIRPMLEKFGATDMETLAVMRDPVDWLGSWYRYRRRAFMAGQRNSTENVSFDQFLTAWMDDHPPPFANVGSQARFLEQRPNGTGVTHLFRYEDQAGLRAFLQDRLGESIETGRANVSPAMALDVSPAVMTRLHEKAAADFALWNAIAVRGGG